MMKKKKKRKKKMMKKRMKKKKNKKMKKKKRRRQRRQFSLIRTVHTCVFRAVINLTRTKWRPLGSDRHSDRHLLGGHTRVSSSQG